ncbi:hypothetical protein E3G68_005066 [Mycobacteroides abscessus]|uniref:hypothetical protein n=1 Tax=Mycobacteroides abscessus TaxID=36809 RepID=UPI001877A490|nr:hypothetical protein [Mycobacteroides abscessus]
MSFEDLLDPGDIFGFHMFGPLGLVAGPVFSELFDEGRKLFGSGDQPKMPPPPQPPPATPPTNGEGPAQEQIDKINQMLADMQKKIEEMHKAGENAADETGNNSDAGRTTHDQILSGGGGLGPALAAQGGTPEADAGRLEALQQQLDELQQNVQDKAGNANGIADSLRNLGMGMPGLGMPSLGGGPGLGMPSLGGGGLGAPAGLGAPPPLSSPARNKDDLKPADLSKPSDVLKPAPVTDPAAPPPTVATPAGTGAAPPPAGSAPGPAAAPPAGAAPPAKPAPNTAGNTPASKDVTLPSGQVVTARTPQGAAAVRQALNRTADSGDVAMAAYAGTGVELPTDGADLGKKVDPADVKPGDIVVFSDHTAIVAGNGQLIGPDGKLQPLGVINDMPGFKGFFDPTATADAPAAPATGATPGAPVTAPTAAPHGSDPSSPTPTSAVMASPGTTKPTTGPIKPPSDPGFGLPAQPNHDS